MLIVVPDDDRCDRLKGRSVWRERLNDIVESIRYVVNVQLIYSFCEGAAAKYIFLWEVRGGVEKGGPKMLREPGKLSNRSGNILLRLENKGVPGNPGELKASGKDRAVPFL